MSETYLVGLDGSETAQRALAFALSQAKQTGASIVLAHIIEWSGLDWVGPEELATRNVDKAKELEWAQSNVITPAQQDCSDANVSHQSFVQHGHATRTLVQAIEQSGATQVFVGRTGHTILENFLFGSTANGITLSSPVPVTVVP